MADNTTQNAPATPKNAPAANTAATSSAVEPEQLRPRNENLETDHGTTVIDDNVVGKIAGIAAREVSGVHNLGGGAARMWGAVRESFTSSTNVQQGVNVAVQDGHVNVAVAIIAEYGVAIHELANAIRENITVAITRMTGLIVDRVDVTVHDVNLPEQETEVQTQQYDEPVNYQAANPSLGQ
ncbi:Asp23/Gls24 family envelope stress response protein [Corynebacterium sp. TA-R-1]|uniref:Asp23/Gls24 family envelope stress response protein n=1 Tax=Corynebacterium stercoris TaxID=2943490 RepID=A0ABT1G1G4_9CORY|nr:Asp23/Gls24 family envelope stress response protein [Corynebacterium stercoris]MCP1387871.1 Asp23/Gls24 family envelope stress response protein [Corynebacterium stercoris]